MAFFVELADDEYGNRMYTNPFPCVIEAEEEGRELIIKGPPEIAEKWDRIIRFNNWLEVDGPARPLTWEEREELIRQKLAESGKSRSR